MTSAVSFSSGVDMAGTIDPITLEVLTQALISTVREMRATVCRTASSVAIYDAKDFSCGLFGPDSQVVAQSEDIGSHVVPLPWSVRSAMEKLGETLAPGDVILVNDPYAGGTHLNDVTIIYPVFRNGTADLLSRCSCALGRCRWHGAGQHVRQGDRDLSGRHPHPASEDHRRRQDERRGARFAACEHARAGGASWRSAGEHHRLPCRRDAHPRDLRTPRRR